MLKCKKCNGNCVKNGFQSNNGKQRYFCKRCRLSFQQNYTYKAYTVSNKTICKLLVNSCGLNDMARILNVSRQTISKRILQIATNIIIPKFSEYYQSYEVDELYVKVNNTICWVTYAINRVTKKVINFVVGRKTNTNLSKVIDAVLLLNPKKVYTDKLKSYVTIIPKSLHSNRRYQTNRIERHNLNLRTHLKRLSRKTLCYSKKIEMLDATLKIYFWASL